MPFIRQTDISARSGTNTGTTKIHGIGVGPTSENLPAPKICLHPNPALGEHPP